MSDLPEPLSSSDWDLRGMPYMALHIVRLFDSEFYALSSGDEFKAAVSLWAKSFLQVPAGSLPINEKLLAHYSGAGKDWAKVREMALHRWVLCSDGRLYHPVVVEVARDAWQSRTDNRARTEAAREARHNKRHTDPTGSVTPPVTNSATDNQTERVTDPATGTVASSVTEKVTSSVTGSKGREGKGREGKGREQESKEDSSSISFSATYPPREAGADGGQPLPKLIWPGDPVPDRPIEPQRRFDTRGHVLESTAKREPYGPVRSVEDQLAILRGEKSA